MRFLADMGVSLKTVESLRVAGHDVVHLREQGLQRLPDPEILAKASREGRIVLTFDLDFGELVAAAGSTLPSTIIFRLRNQTAESVTPRLEQVVKEESEQISAGAVVIVEESVIVFGDYRLPESSRIPRHSATNLQATDRERRRSRLLDRNHRPVRHLIPHLRPQLVLARLQARWNLDVRLRQAHIARNHRHSNDAGLDAAEGRGSR